MRGRALQPVPLVQHVLQLGFIGMGSDRKGVRRSIFKVSVGELIDDELVSVTRSTSVDTLLQRFVTEGIDRVVVLNARGRPIGVVSKSELLMRAALGSSATAGDLVSGMVTVPASRTLAEASALMVRRNLEGLLVTFDHRFAWLSPAHVVKWVAAAAHVR